MSSGTDYQVLVAAALEGDRRAMARLISLCESDGELASQIDRCLKASPSSSGWTIGITGAPGAGKSTLVNELLDYALSETERVGVLAVDPSSPLTRGALLGDRVRMQKHTNDPQVYIRSMASRGHYGGLSIATRQALRILHACDWPLAIVETVGVGQVEVEVAAAAEVVVVVLNPGWGDEIQANKAGLMEIADIFVINKADRPGLENTRRDLEGALAMMREEKRPIILETVASQNKGVAELWQTIAKVSDRTRFDVARKERAFRAELEEMAQALAQQRIKQRLISTDALESAMSGETALHEIALKLLDP